jgi:hypothetical protein
VSNRSSSSGVETQVGFSNVPWVALPNRVRITEAASLTEGVMLQVDTFGALSGLEICS